MRPIGFVWNLNSAVDLERKLTASLGNTMTVNRIYDTLMWQRIARIFEEEGLPTTRKTMTPIDFLCLGLVETDTSWIAFDKAAVVA